ncbi:MAG: peptidyl-prolyl cis-trans isomerase [Rhizobacter sp.]|nr:peptidyl-prolyl cis-trans isomerase [Chlorobiales bacterium]
MSLIFFDHDTAKRRLDLRFAYFFLSVLAASYSGCTGKSSEPPVAKTGNSTLTTSDLHRSIHFTTPEDSATAAAIYIEDWLASASLYEQALEDGQAQDTLTQLLIEKSRRLVTVQQYLERKFSAERNGKLKVDSAEVKTYFERHAAEFSYRETAYQLTRLYASGADTAAALRLLLSDRNLTATALEKKTILLAPAQAERNAQELRFASALRSVLELQLENESVRGLLEKMQPGDISPVVKAENVFVVMRLAAKVGRGEAKPFSEAFAEAETRVRLEKQKIYYNELLAAAKAKFLTK